MQLDHLKLFIDLAKTLHFGKTSRNGFVTPATLTRIIQRLESRVGHPLFYRDNRSVSLTKAGQIFKSYCEEELQRWEELETQLGQSTGIVSGLVRIYCSVTASHSILSDVLSPIKCRYPDIAISLITGPSQDTYQKLRQNEVDIGITSLSKYRPSEFIVKPIKQIPLVIIAPKGKNLESIRTQEIPFIFPQSDHSKRYVQDWFDKQDIRPKVYTEKAGFDGAMSLVALGYGASVVPRLVLETNPLNQKIDVLDIDPPLTDLLIGICCKKRSVLSPCVSVFMD